MTGWAYCSGCHERFWDSGEPLIVCPFCESWSVIRGDTPELVIRPLNGELLARLEAAVDAALAREGL